MNDTAPAEESTAKGPRTETRVVTEGTLKRLTSGPGQFALAIGACLLLVLAVFLITPGTPDGERDKLLPTVAYTWDAKALARAAKFETYVPEGLPEAWRANSTRLTGTNGGDRSKIAWHLGFATPSGAYASLEQSNEEPDGPKGFVRRMTSVFQSNPQQAIGTETINGRSWDKFHQRDKEQNSLVLRLPETTLVVTGTAGFPELVQLAASLKRQPIGG